MVKDLSRGKIVIYKTRKGPEFEVRLKEETVWLTQKQISELFDKGVPAVNEHIKNIYKEGELDKKSTIRKFRIVQTEGKRRIERETDLYNLDMILSVGYRVSSKRATQFRIWATKTLKNYLIKGYAVNEKRLLQAENKFNELRATIDFLKNKARHELFLGQEQEILNLLSNYSKTLILLERYDKNNYLYRESGERKINDNALVALALLIAVSDPGEKDIMIRIITNILS